MSGTSTESDTGSQPSVVNPGHESLKERVEDLIQFIDSHKFCLMTTRQKNSEYLVSRCMAVAAREGIDILFHTDTESGKTDELVGDPHVNIGFLKESTGDWASVSGTACIITDRELVKKYYSNQLKAWVGDLGDGVHDGGPNDPRVGVIKIHMRTATYCLSQGNAFTRGIEVAKGSITGKPAQVNKLRELTESELDMYRTLIS
ncbi:hypothetical protein L211DRAFT_824601 [Terfezia boudieri ATCC MYA-4762]|uniref:General stress protein FMN-binding split barrel domain-containing protein n=1 Tax=Terfezia boudieri ATCC MYA-4762 TaxID=1051890 RepID=A0A3N4LMG8_9PEZI|nr:hypothetical protein L211DRAFT_824601 [Terfezia boudieri ATCC MYA-4762]